MIEKLKKIRFWINDTVKIRNDGMLVLKTIMAIISMFTIAYSLGRIAAFLKQYIIDSVIYNYLVLAIIMVVCFAVSLCISKLWSREVKDYWEERN